MAIRSGSLALVLAVCAVLAASVSGSPASSRLSLAPSTNDLCPVIRYSTAVDAIPAAELSQMKLSAMDSDLASAAASTHAQPYRVTLKPLSYATNATHPSVDWMDLHFKVVSSVSGAQPQRDVKMQAVGDDGSHMASEKSSDKAKMAEHMKMAMPMAMPTKFQFGPIFLSPSDELLFGATICASMIDCDTETHSFKPESEEQLQQRKKQKQSEQEQLQKQQQEQQQPQAEPLQAQPPKRQQLPRQQIQQPAGEGCPAIAFTQSVSCGDDKCKLSFINLSPQKPLSWVDVHVKSNSRSFLEASGLLPTADVVLVQSNFRMKLGAGGVDQSMMGMTMPGHSSGDMAMTAMNPEQQSSLHAKLQQEEAQTRLQLNSAEDLHLFGPDSSPSHLLASTGGSQVWQFGLPLNFRSGDLLFASFTYCASGTDCDTEEFKYRLEEDEEPQQERLVREQHNQQKQKQNPVGHAELEMMQHHQQLQEHREL